MSDFNMEEFKQFEKTHSPQMEAIGFPLNLHMRLYQKLRNEDFDIGTKVKIIIDKDNEKMMVTPTLRLDAEEDVYLIDHAWTFRYYEAYEMLKENKKLRYRMKNIMNYPDKIDITKMQQAISPASGDTPTTVIPDEYKEEKLNLLKYLENMPDGPTIYNLDDYGIVALDNIPFKDDATEISLFGNNISDPHTVTDNLLKFEHLKALWLNDNPIEESCHNFDEIGEFLKSIEIINSKFTSRAGEWALMFCAKDQGVD
jgi:tubulin--tyrosine ligase-like protein 12